MIYKHIIWDWNGTLVDDAWLCVEIMNKVLDKYKLKQISLSDYRELFVFPVKDYYADLGFNLKKTPFEVCGLDFVNSFKNRKFDAPLFRESKKILSKIKLEGGKNYLLSANHQSVLEDTIDFFKLRSSFSEVCGLNHYYATSKIKEGKKLLSSINSHKKNIVMVGDTLHDFEVAQSLEIDCLLLSHGHNNKERLTKTSAPVFSSLKELADFLRLTVN